MNFALFFWAIWAKLCFALKFQSPTGRALPREFNTHIPVLWSAVGCVFVALVRASSAQTGERLAASSRVCTNFTVEARCIALVLTSLGLQHRALRRLESGFFCPGKYVCMLWAGQCFVSERKRPRIAEMDCAGKRCLRSRVCNGTPLVISASAGQGAAIIPGQVHCTPAFVNSSALTL